MESADVVVAVSHSKSPNLDKPKVDIIVDRERNTDEGSNPVNTADDNEQNKYVGQETVIIEEVVSKIIDLNEDSDEEIELEIVQNTSDLSHFSKNSPTKATEFVVVNAANLSHPAIDVMETAVEDIQIKDELSESINAVLNANDVLENDPMDLLELNHRSESSSSIRSQEETDYADDGSSVGSSSIQTGSSSSISVLDWIKDYPWLLYEEGDEQLGYCLYCDVKINTKSQRSLKQHGISLYHKERCENYMAFREEEEKNGLGVKLVEIKEEFGTDSRVEALKLKRKSQSVALNNFNWRRWLEDYPWLQRDSTEGTIGLCKYCLIHVNVEFSYLRDRHQEGSRHRDAEKQHGSSNEADDLNKSVDTNENRDYTADNSSSKNYRWLEILEEEPTMARCKICGSKVVKTNFLRHLTTKLHEHNEKIFLESQKADKHDDLNEDTGKTQQNWRMFTKLHPWMTSDPENPLFAYCKYCEKRIVYGSSAAKRAMHEHSFHHKHNEIEFKRRSLTNVKKQNENGKAGDSPQKEVRTQVDEEEGREDEDEENAEEKEEDRDDEENESDAENSKDNESEEDVGEQVQEEKESENESKKRPKILTDEWLKQYSWCRKFKKDPTNFIFCIYCRIPLRPNSRRKHQNSSIHNLAEKEFLNQQPKKEKLEERKQNNENLPFYEWAIPLRNNPSNYSCRYCRVRISKNYSKKQHASSKIHQINESIYKNNRRKSLRNDENNTDAAQPLPKTNTQQTNIATTKDAFAKVVIKAPSTVALIKQHQKKFPWLGYKRSELRTHYGHCKICESSLYIRSLKHILRHTRSARHMSILKAKKRQKVEKDEGSEANENMIDKVSKEELQTSPATVTEGEDPILQVPESQKGFCYKSTIAEMKKRYSWIEKSERANYAFCRFCNVNIPLKILFLRNHGNSPKHRNSVISSYSIDGRKNTRDNHRIEIIIEDGSKTADAENDVLIVEDNSEEILISEQDENWAVKSEMMDEHEELDYLLQRSFDNSSNIQRNVRKSANIGDEPPTKRVKRSQSFKRLADSNSSLVASLLTAPLTLASCLGPLIQQQIQQANLLQVQNSSSATTTPTIAPKSSALIESANTYDLFFKSVSETMKKLPADLAAEGKLRVMQVLCDLELQALKRDDQSARSEPASNNYSGVLNYQSTPTFINTASNNSFINDISTEQNGNSNETIITQLNVNTDNSPPSTTIIHPKVTNSNTTESPTTSSAPSPIIGVMDKNGLQTLQLKTAFSKQIPKNATSTITSVSNSGIRCIPFKNLSQPVASDGSNQKIARIQVPMNIPQHGSTQTANAVNTSKNLINFRNIQVTKRIGTPPSSITHTVPQQAIQKTPSMTNSSPQRTYITNIQPHLQRWGCSVNGSTSHQTPTSTTVNHPQQLSSQRTSTSISKK